MKWVKVAIGAVIAISVIPLIVGIVGNVTTKTVSYDINVISINDNIIEYTPITLYDNLKDILYKYGTFTDDPTGDYYGYNVDLLFDNELVDNILLFYSINSDEITLYDKFLLESNNNLYDEGLGFEIGIYTIQFTNLPSSLSPSIITLIGLVPLIFVAGVVSYLFVKTKTKEDF